MPDRAGVSRFRLLVIGDISGPETYHAGDEAMLAANLLELRRRIPDLEVTVVSKDPDWSARRYDCHAVAPPDTGDDPPGVVEGYRRTIRDGASGHGDAPPPVLTALRRSDALLISGGGNLNSTWPHLLYQRIALMEGAHELGIPVAVVGQTLGPHLESRHREDLFRALAGAAFVGLRELDSVGLALEAVTDPRRVHYQVDDAFLLPPRAGSAISDLPEEPWIAVTLAGGPGPREAVKAAFRSVAELTGAPLVLIPHAAHPDRDLELARELFRELPGLHRTLPVLDCQEVVDATSRAALVISTRYHPLVFAAAAGVPSLGLYVDDYTRVKLRGALAHDDLENWSLEAQFAWHGDLLPAVEELWHRREEVATHLRRRRPLHEALHRRHLQMLESALTGTPPLLPEELPPLPVLRTVAPRPAGAWAKRAAHYARQADTQMRHARALLWQRDEAVRYALSLRSTLDRKDEEIAALRRAATETP